MSFYLLSGDRVNAFRVVEVIKPPKKHSDVLVDNRGGLSVNHNIGV